MTQSLILLDSERIERLHDLQLFGQQDPILNAYATLAAKALYAPISGISLVDYEGQVFCSQVGLPKASIRTQDLPLLDTLCQVTLLSEEPLVIQDLQLESDMKDSFDRNHTDKGLWFTAFAGSPLVATDGTLIGTCFVIDKKPRHWTNSEISILQELAGIIVSNIDQRLETLKHQRLSASHQENALFFQQILNGIQDLIVVKNDQSQILWANEAYKTYHSGSSQAADNFDLEFSPRSERDTPVNIQKVTKNPAIKESAQHKFRNGEIQQNLTSKLAEIDSVSGAKLRVEVSKTIPEFSRIERRSEEEIEEAFSVDDLRIRLLSMISHEFRTPLAVIMTSTGIMRKRLDNFSRDQQLYQLEKIENQVNKLVDLLDEVLHISRSGVAPLKPRLSEVDIIELCQQIVLELQETTDKHTLVFSSKKKHCVTAVDAKLINQAISNLLTNAIKYSPNGGNILIEVNDHMQHIEISVTDSGIGIPSHEQPGTFEVFQRASNVGNIPGTGLGLTIVRRAVEAHGGTIFVSSQINAGSKFVVTIPLSGSH